MAFVAALLLILIWLMVKSAVVTYITMLILGALHHSGFPDVPAPGFITLFPTMVGLVLLLTLLFGRVEVKR